MEWLGEVPEGWEVFPLKAWICFIESGRASRSHRHARRIWAGGLVKTSDVERVIEQSSNEEQLVEAEEIRIAVSCFVNGDILMPKSDRTP